MNYSKVAALLFAAFSAVTCYSETAKTYQPIDMSDLKVDIKDMMGKRVTVRASVQTMGDISMLKSDPVDMTPVWATTDKLPREDRKKLANGCQLLLCNGLFSGVIHKGVFGPALAVEKVEWK